MGDKKPTVCVDFDGVLSLYTGWRGPRELDPPREGAREFMRALAERYEVIILTTRTASDVYTWLEEHDFPGVFVTDSKPPAIAYVDDRAILFDGSFDGLVDRIAAFKAHWEATHDPA